MNRSKVFNTIGRIMRWGAILLLLPAGVALIYGEDRCLLAFLISAAIALVLYFALFTVFDCVKHKKGERWFDRKREK